jgi:hypothetical protein
VSVSATFGVKEGVRNSARKLFWMILSASCRHRSGLSATTLPPSSSRADERKWRSAGQSDTSSLRMPERA